MIAPLLGSYCRRVLQREFFVFLIIVVAFYAFFFTVNELLIFFSRF